MPVIKVIGVGGGGCRAVNGMIPSDLKGVTFIAVDTDKDSLRLSKAESSLLIGKHIARDWGADAYPVVGENAAYGNSQSLRRALSGADIVFIVAGLGGDAGSGGAPIIAKIAREEGALCIAVVTEPFDTEGSARKQRAEKCILELNDVVDSYVVIRNQNIRKRKINEKQFASNNPFRESDRLIGRTVVPILDAVLMPGHLNAEIQDIRMILSGAGRAYSGTGEGVGPDRAVNAARNVLLELEQFGYLKSSARKVLVNITIGLDSGIDELVAILDDVKKSMASEAEIRFSAVVKENLQNRIRVSVLAAACDHEQVKCNVDQI